LAVFVASWKNWPRRFRRQIYSERGLETRLNDLVNDIFKKWRTDQANLSSYARDLFGEGSLSEPAKLIQKLAETAATPSAVASAGGLVGSLTVGLTESAAVPDSL
jgi:hypothetical protein